MYCIAGVFLTFYKIMYCVSQNKTEIPPVFPFPATFDNYQSYQKKTILVKKLKIRPNTHCNRQLTPNFDL